MKNRFAEAAKAGDLNRDLQSADFSEITKKSVGRRPTKRMQTIECEARDEEVGAGGVPMSILKNPYKKLSEQTVKEYALS